MSDLMPCSIGHGKHSPWMERPAPGLRSVQDALRQRTDRGVSPLPGPRLAVRGGEKWTALLIEFEVQDGQQN